MAITPIGWLLIPMGCLFFLCSPSGLYSLTVFFVPFSATSILNSGSGESGSGLQPFMFFGLLLLLRDTVEILWRMKIRISEELRVPLILYTIFLCVCSVSMLMPVWINGQIAVPTNGLLSASLEPLVFTPGRLKILFGLIYGFLLTISIARRNLTPQNFLRTLRIYLVSGAFISLWGLFQAVLFFAHVPYPYQVFNNSASPNAGGFSAVLDTVAVSRVSSVSLEPSTLALTVIGMIPFLVLSIASKKPIFGQWKDRLLFTLLGLTLVLTTSSTGYAGFGALLVLLPFSVPGIARLRKRIWQILVSMGILATITYIGIPPVRGIIQETILNKSSSYSALERGAIILLNYQYFREYPLLGIGWGSAPTHDMVLGILSSCGLLGLASFLGLFSVILLRLRTEMANDGLSAFARGLSSAMFLSAMATLAAYLVSALPGGGTFYLVVGLAIAAGRFSVDNAEPGRTHQRFDLIDPSSPSGAAMAKG